MDISALQTQISNQQALVDSVQETLKEDQDALDSLNAELKVASLVNSLETLTADEITAINSLLAEPANPLGVTITVTTPPAAAEADTNV